MESIEIPEFKDYEEEAAFGDQLDTAPYMEDDGEWFQFETHPGRAIRVAILPELARALSQLAHSEGVAVETLVNAFLLERLQQGVSLKGSS